MWFGAIKGQRPDAWDGAGAILCLLGAATILVSQPARS
jgi:small multidrug resistance family-3 protein